MCGRFNLTSPLEDIIQTFGLNEPGSLVNLTAIAPSYNIAPGQEIPVVCLNGTTKQLASARWGLVPHWSKVPKTKYATINARAETVADKPTYREPFKHKRCLIPANGFYEWQQTDGRKIPHHICMQDGGLFAFAGLWDRWAKDGVDFISCSIIVTTANNLIRPIHDRMPVIMDSSDYDKWLDNQVTDKEILKRFLKPYSETNMNAYPISTFVNTVKNNTPECIEPIV